MVASTTEIPRCGDDEGKSLPGELGIGSVTLQYGIAAWSRAAFWIGGLEDESRHHRDRLELHDRWFRF